MSKILLSPSSFGQISIEPVKMLERQGYQITHNPFGRKLTAEEVVDLGRDCVGIVAGVENLSREVLLNLPKLQCISRVGTGLDNVDLDAANETGITVKNTPFGPTQAVAELAIGLAFALLREIPMADADLKNRIWSKRTGNLLQGKTIGVIGLGRIGKKVAEMFSKFETKVQGYDIAPDFTWALESSVKIVDLDNLLATSDLVSIHVPGSCGRPVLSAENLKGMKKGAWLVNLARGGVVDEREIYKMLEKKHLAGAAIDVFSEEPYTGELCDLNNVILTPHLGSYAMEAKLKMELEAVENLLISL
ncbi:phosphoglycerate dehydrogenase [Akkermansiaceae bacterium]|nr:phosphoglycerate dehydrogenase [Akkermansiaceae bacterium]